MTTKTDPKAPARPAAAEPIIDESAAAELYSNFVAANITPVDFNLIFGQAGVPKNVAAGVEVPWPSHVKYVAKIALPLPVLPLLVKLLEAQMDRARAAGVTIPEAKPEERKP